ncbi:MULTISPECIES: VOC family protein [Thalassospira]|uniref:3-demethylubiquinone-9 3-methyltransferase n=1 Tax=Thalassospira permensis NBRC 106175 TaxID=1353532 RepID=A0ABR4TPZ4_9PROT|nr:MULTISPECIES: VOC family protein [Thalassospira]KEO57736.1 3-demethylubiquinone-9 3-methyltransferase [Thalassospira permensis NBRC 106175]RCK40812.1 3-demethylubiquinone-9 3-methyltransferase [Thalassospira xiamenensis]
MKLITYLNFDGNCRQAFEFYQSVLGGELIMMPFGDTPMAGDTAELNDKIAHACLMGDGWHLMASDCPPGYFAKMQGMTASLHFEKATDARKMFDTLSSGGEVTMPFEETFWSPGYGMFTDKFGTPWMINTEMSPEDGAGCA